jgi:hypothetical protein
VAICKRSVQQFAMHFGKSPDKLGPDELRTLLAFARGLVVSAHLSSIATAALPACYWTEPKQSHMLHHRLRSRRWVPSISPVSVVAPRHRPRSASNGSTSPSDSVIRPTLARLTANVVPWPKRPRRARQASNPCVLSSTAGCIRAVPACPGSPDQDFRCSG